MFYLYSITCNSLLTSSFTLIHYLFHLSYYWVWIILNNGIFSMQFFNSLWVKLSLFSQNTLQLCSLSRWIFHWSLLSKYLMVLIMNLATRMFFSLVLYYNLSITLLWLRFKSLNKRQLLYWVILENLIEFQVQTNLPYILWIMVYVHTITNLF